MEPSNLPPQAPNQDVAEPADNGVTDAAPQQVANPAPEPPTVDAPTQPPADSAAETVLVDNPPAVAETTTPQQDAARPAKPADKGAGLPIFAAAVIVVALAALAVVAYLKSSGNL